MADLNSFNRKLQATSSVSVARDETKLRKERFQQLEAGMRQEALRSRYPFLEGDLLQRMLDYGFCPESATALAYAPIAMIAWGSGSVTEDERLMASSTIVETELRGNIAGIQQFGHWFDERPSHYLLELWGDFVREQCKFQNSSTRRAAIDLLNRIHARGMEVALASGGFIGIGKVCDGEAMVLDFIEELTFEVTGSGNSSQLKTHSI